MSAAVLQEIDEKLANYCHRELMSNRDVIDILLDIRSMVAAEDHLFSEPEPEPVLA